MSTYSARSQFITAVGRPTWKRRSYQFCSCTAKAWEHALILSWEQGLPGQQPGIQTLGWSEGNDKWRTNLNWAGCKLVKEEEKSRFQVGSLLMLCPELTAWHLDAIPFPRAPQIPVTTPAWGFLCQAWACKRRRKKRNLRIAGQEDEMTSYCNCCEWNRPLREICMSAEHHFIH